jgi:predicted  nucleic acid-binding Zn-ribbon protein
MFEQLSSLIALQQHDAAVDDLAKKAAAFDPIVKKKQQALDALKSDLKAAKDKLGANTLKKKELEGEADAKQKLVQKHQGELNALKSNDAYKAMLGEIDAAKKAVIAAEDQILVVMEAIEAAEKEFKEREKKFKADEAAMKAEISKVEAQKAEAVAAVAKRKEERDAFAKTIPGNAVAQYDAVRAKRDGVAIVPMVNGSCAGCRMTLPPHQANDVKKGKSVVICESCSRIIYLPPENQAAATPAASPATPATPAS